MKYAHIQVIGGSVQSNGQLYEYFSTTMFKGKNFGFWSIKMKTLFLSQDLWDFVENGYREADAHALGSWTQDQRN